MFTPTKEKIINSYSVSITLQEKILSLFLFCYLVNIMWAINTVMYSCLRLKRKLAILCFHFSTGENFVIFSLLLLIEYYDANHCLYAEFPPTEEKIIKLYFVTITLQEKMLSLFVFCYLVNIMWSINKFVLPLNPASRI